MEVSTLVWLMILVVVVPVGTTLWLARRSHTGSMDRSMTRREAWFQAHPRSAALIQAAIPATGPVAAGLVWWLRNGERGLGIAMIALGIVGGAAIWVVARLAAARGRRQGRSPSGV